jgi:hypothetical protein
MQPSNTTQQQATKRTTSYTSKNNSIDPRSEGQNKQQASNKAKQTK